MGGKYIGPDETGLTFVQADYPDVLRDALQKLKRINAWLDLKSLAFAL